MARIRQPFPMLQHLFFCNLLHKYNEDLKRHEVHTKEFDNFLYKNVGYERLKPFIKDLFLDPYSCTSLQEYFSTCFEKYFLSGNHNLLKDMCPYVYKKIYSLVNQTMEDVS